MAASYKPHIRTRRSNVYNGGREKWIFILQLKWWLLSPSLSVPSQQALLARSTEISTHTKFYLQTHLCCYQCPLQSHRLTLIGSFKQAMSVRLFPRMTERRKEGRKRGKIVCGLWKPGDCAAEQITSRQLGMEPEKCLWKKKEPARKQQASNARGKTVP